MKPTRSQRGATLIEALVALGILLLSLVAALQLQVKLRVNADLARERSIALRWAQQDLERVRAARSASAFDGEGEQRATLQTPDASFSLQRTAHSEESLKTFHTRIHWQHRASTEQDLQLISSTHRLSPVYSAALALPPQGTFLAHGRRLPAGTVSHLEGRQLFKPTPASQIAWVIDGLSGSITAQCQVTSASRARDLNASDLSRCEPFMARLVRGYIRFALSHSPDPLHANDTPLPLAVRAGDARCESDTIAADGERYIAYACALPTSSSSEEPTLEPQGWTFGSTASTFRACRYPAAPRAPRNYLVIRGDLPCPSAVTPHNGAPVVTAQHQP